VAELDRKSRWQVRDDVSFGVREGFDRDLRFEPMIGPDISATRGKAFGPPAMTKSASFCRPRRAVDDRDKSSFQHVLDAQFVEHRHDTGQNLKTARRSCPAAGGNPALRAAARSPTAGGVQPAPGRD